jgi:hypothetical protein
MQELLIQLITLSRILQFIRKANKTRSFAITSTGYPSDYLINVLRIILTIWTIKMQRRAVRQETIDHSEERTASLYFPNKAVYSPL